ncbi:protein ELYS-like [Cuculus canorus]|uniref:protein ELYS-like n=1 Tax=Cuculus canorus TaxID=55661 RepID=UPI0023AAF970|nr:protein ELYS-like [Cuculus canorus]XP_053919967.1 protein ELYS-like [Cuculus canorus]XP_053919969.1 protein ELYS-like [Cuculus canorus]
MVLWFCQAGLLPEGLDETTQLSPRFYHYHQLQTRYAAQRQKLDDLSRGKQDSDCLMIDGIVSQFGDQVAKLWQRKEGGTGKYPPPNLHALLDLYLLENTDEIYKHAITIYLLQDISSFWQPKMEKIVNSFATTFALPQGLVKLIEGFWLLDNHECEKSLALLCHPRTMKIEPWLKTRVLRSLICRGERKKALKYIQSNRERRLNERTVSGRAAAAAPRAARLLLSWALLSCCRATAVVVVTGSGPSSTLKCRP